MGLRSAALVTHLGLFSTNKKRLFAKSSRGGEAGEGTEGRRERLDGSPRRGESGKGVVWARACACEGGGRALLLGPRLAMADARYEREVVDDAYFAALDQAVTQAERIPTRVRGARKGAPSGGEPGGQESEVTSRPAAERATHTPRGSLGIRTATTATPSPARRSRSSREMGTRRWNRPDHREHQVRTVSVSLRIIGNGEARVVFVKGFSDALDFVLSRRKGAPGTTRTKFGPSPCQATTSWTS